MPTQRLCELASGSISENYKEKDKALQLRAMNNQNSWHTVPQEGSFYQENADLFPHLENIHSENSKTTCNHSLL